MTKELDSLGRIKTLNKMGFMFETSHPLIETFLEHVALTKGHFADIGAAYGHIFLQVLKKRGKVTAIDLEPGHLESLKQN